MLNLSRIIPMLILALSVAACGTTISIQDGDMVVDSSISFTEAQLNAGDTNILSFDNVTLIENAEIDIQDGVIMADGSLQCPDDSREDGTMTIRVAATENGLLNVEITDVSADCLSMESDLIATANQEIADAMTQAAQDTDDSDGSFTFTEVTLADDTLTLAFEVRAPLDSDSQQ